MIQMTQSRMLSDKFLKVMTKTKSMGYLPVEEVTLLEVGPHNQFILPFCSMELLKYHDMLRT